MNTIVATLLRTPGLLNVSYEQFYSFQLKGKDVNIFVHKKEKGLKIVDTENKIEREENNSKLAKTLSIFGAGSLLQLGHSNDKNTIPAPEKSIFIAEEGQGSRDIFVIERFYTDLVIFVEYESFNEDEFRDDKRRERYNQTVLDAYNHFVARYILVEMNAPIKTLTFKEGKGFNLSYALRQYYFKKDQGMAVQEYLQTIDRAFFLRNTITIEHQGADGIEGASEDYIKGLTEKLQSTIAKPLTSADVFLSSAYQEINLGNYRFALLEGFVAVEAAVEKFLLSREKKSKMPEKKKDQFKRDKGIGYQTNIAIPHLLGNAKGNYDELLVELNAVRKLRNKIVHEGFAVEYQETIEGVMICEKYVTYLNQAVR